MKQLLTGIALAALCFSTPAFAHDHEHEDEERISHYAVEAPETRDAAIAVLTGKTAEIGTLLQKAPLDSNDLEAIHERTYALESAVDKLVEDAVTDIQKASLEATDEAVQALHHASEDHEEARTRESFGKLETAVSALQNAFNAQAD